MAQRAARIVRDDDVMDGESRIDGRRITVLRIQELVGLSASGAPAGADGAVLSGQCNAGSRDCITRGHAGDDNP